MSPISLGVFGGSYVPPTGPEPVFHIQVPDSYPGSGVILNDLSDNGHVAWLEANASVVSSPTPSIKLIESTVLSNHNGDYDLNYTPSTVMGWLFWEINECALVEHGYYTGSGGWMIWLVGTEVRWYVRKAARVNLGVEKNQWVHIAGTLNGTHAKLYRNGGQTKASSVYTQYPENVTSPLRIGGYGSGNWKLRGNLNDIRIYHEALSEQQISDIYESTKTIYGH